MGPADPSAPGPQWPLGALVLGQYDVPIPADAELGEYELSLMVLDTAGDVLFQREVGPVTIYPNATPTPEPS